MPDVGPVVAQSIARVLRRTRTTARWSSSCCAAGVQLAGGAQPTPSGAGPLAGKTFVLTGTLPIADPRRGEGAHRGGRRQGGGSVSKKTDYVVAGSRSGQQARQGRGARYSCARRGGLLELLQTMNAQEAL